MINLLAMESLQVNNKSKEESKSTGLIMKMTSFSRKYPALLILMVINSLPAKT
jgi:hypothetical protein